MRACRTTATAYASNLSATRRQVVAVPANVFCAVTMVVAVPGCESEAADWTRRPTVRDSGGVVIVENPDTPKRLERWVVDMNPTLAIGADLRASPNYQFASIRGALRTVDGGVVVADGDADQSLVRKYGADGKYVATWGREGEGPGEFKSIMGMHRLPPDSVVIWDSQLDRLTVFDSGGSLGSTSRLQIGNYALMGTIAGGGFLFAEIRTFAFQTGVQHPDGYHRYDKTYRIHDRSAHPIAIIGPFPGQEYHNTITSTALRFAQLPYSRETWADTWKHLPVVGVSDTYELRAYQADGSLERIVRLDRPPTPTTEADRLAFLQADQEYARPDRANVPLASHLPLFDAIIGDELGCLWVRDYGLPGEGPTTWTVFDSNGAALARSEMPDNLRIWEIGQEYVLGSQVDPLGIQSLLVMPLQRTDCR